MGYNSYFFVGFDKQRNQIPIDIKRGYTDTVQRVVWCPYPEGRVGNRASDIGA